VNVEIISIGTELMHGLTVDTNSAWLSRRSAALGLRVGRHVTIADDASAIAEAVRGAVGQAGVVLVSGGLGPTVDDLTRQGLAAAMGQPLVEDEASLRSLEAFFQRLQRPMTDSNRLQALLPRGAQAIANVRGTAPGIRARLGGAVIYVMPGVPEEMRAMFERSIEPELAALGSGAAIVVRTICCFGATEANIGGQIEDLMAIGREPVVGITASEGVIRVRIVARGRDAASAAAMAEADAVEVRRRLGRLVFGEGDCTLQEAVADLLLASGLSVATAESCTGGLLAKCLTDVPGSSGYFWGGFVTYANEAKVAQLGVPRGLIDQYGAVSQEVADAMARGCRRAIGAEVGISITGIAGPSGGTAEKPVGLVYLGLADEERCVVERRLMGEHLERASIRDRACKVALNMLRQKLMGLEA